MYSNYLQTGTQNVQNIGIALAFVGASLEIGVVVSITILERRKELTVLSVRGMSSRQISSILLIEILSIVGFALTLGVLVGLIIILGIVNSSAQSGQLVTQRLTFPLGTVMLIVGMMTLVLMAVIIPIVIAARRAPSDARRKGGW
jgi:ABC-type antimicrobial peptide transport system permease subunit